MPKIEYTKRTTQYINRKPIQSIFDAVEFARKTDQPLNYYVVINFRDTVSKCPSTAFNQIRHKFRDWLNYALKKRGENPYPPAYIYSLENPNNNPHANWVVHIPEGLETEFVLKLEKWVFKVEGAVGPHDIHCQMVNQLYAKRLAKYVVKGAAPEFVSHFYLDDMANDQGEVFGKRAGCSPAIGLTARTNAGYRRKRGYQWRHAA